MTANLSKDLTTLSFRARSAREESAFCWQRHVRRYRRGVVLVLLLSALFASAQQPALKDALRNDFHIGVAINYAQTFERNERDSALIKAQFDSLSPENALKWEPIHPKPDAYNFAAADRYVEFGQQNHMWIIGHCLIWHNQTPKWVFEGTDGKPATRDQLLARMREHISTVVGRYKGKINGWDVVNEAISDEDGSLRKSPWQTIIGDDFIEKAFQYAHEADPAAELYYNDYSLENPKKRAGALALLKKLKEENIPVTAVGLQGHYAMDWPTLDQLDETITQFAALGLKVVVTELDIDVLPQAVQTGSAEITLTAESQPKLDPYKDGLPDAMQKALADRYAGLFRIFLKHKDAVTRVTLWGLTDADSWKNNWPIRGRTNYPLLFDRNGKPKLAFDAVIAAAKR